MDTNHVSLALPEAEEAYPLPTYQVKTDIAHRGSRAVPSQIRTCPCRSPSEIYRHKVSHKTLHPRMTGSKVGSSYCQHDTPNHLEAVHMLMCHLYPCMHKIRTCMHANKLPCIRIHAQAQSDMLTYIQWSRPQPMYLRADMHTYVHCFVCVCVRIYTHPHTHTPLHAVRQ